MSFMGDLVPYPTIMAYDKTLMRVCCPILQAAYGGNMHVSGYFHAEQWIVEPTDNIKLYTVKSEAEMMQIVAMTRPIPEENLRLDSQIEGE